MTEHEGGEKMIWAAHEMRALARARRYGCNEEDAANLEKWADDHEAMFELLLEAYPIIAFDATTAEIVYGGPLRNWLVKASAFLGRPVPWEEKNAKDSE